INNIVDITNYLLHATGQPLHCFDLNEIKGGKVVVRTAVEGSKFVTLDEVGRTLTAQDLMICNAEEPMCIAGVFGGLKSGVTEKTTDIFLESAYFHPTWVRKTARRQALNTDASFRFERGIDNNNLIYVLKRAALMVQELAGGVICGDIIDTHPEGFPAFPVTLTYDKAHKLIGKEIPAETIKSILNNLEIEIVAEDSEKLELLVPTYRVDVQRDVDVIEDILRIYGYNNVEFTDAVHSNLSYKTATDENHRLQNLISEQLTGCGFNEIMCNSLSAVSYYEGCEEYPDTRCARLLNPLSNDLCVMRQTLLFGGLESLARNINRRRPNLRMYEFGNCYFYNAEASTEKSITAPYSEEKHLGLWLTGNRVAGSWAHPDEKTSVYELKAYVENIFTRMGVPSKDITMTQISNGIFSAALQITNRAGKLLAMVGILSKKVAKKFDIDIEVYFAEINWDNLMRYALRNKVTYTELPKFQAVKRDLALLVDESVAFADIERVAYETERKLLKEVTLFDVYEGDKLPAGKKSYAVSFLLQDAEKTLNDKQIDNVMTRMIAAMTKQFDAQLR
ncbi:MAG: phenylalanine--tRNA ligase subunit beta, partial [Bacteroidaceae bacterium]|nr:phenylalanine--tRNA ligase subunit beta [Bacteroidaceae bacterium]